MKRIFGGTFVLNMYFSHSLSTLLWVITVIIVLIAIAGKGIACMLAARVAGETWRDSATIGTLMNARGLMELIILNIGLERGLITPTLFTIMVLMTIITTLMVSPLFHLIYYRNIHARDHFIDEIETVSNR